MTYFIEEEKVTAALEAGASGYVLKDAEAEEVAAAVRAAWPARCTWTRPSPGSWPSGCGRKRPARTSRSSP